MELYSSMLKLAPILLLKLLAVGAIGLSQGEGRSGRLPMITDALLLMSIVGGGFVAALVLGDAIPSTEITRWTVVIAGCLSLVLLATYMLREIAALYRARARSTDLTYPSGHTSDSSEREA